MNDSFTFLIIVTAMLIVTVALLKIGKVRYVYIVPKGYAGLLYHKGKFVGAQLLARVQPEAAKIGINVNAVEVKDVMFAADLKRAFADVLKAKQEGQAALERARGESASLRNLANAARVLEGNPALMNLRLIQSRTAAQNTGNTLVVGMPVGFVPLKNGKSGAHGSTTHEDGAS